MSSFRIRSPIRFEYKIYNITLKILTEIRDYSECVVAKAYSRLGFFKRICSQFQNPYSLVSIWYMQYASVAQWIN